jgi:hypothetical protein
LEVPKLALRKHRAYLAASNFSGPDASFKTEIEQMWRVRIATDYALYLLGDRENDAKRFLTGAITLMDTPELRIACVEAALEEGEPRPEHVELLKQAAAGADTAEISKRLEAALAAGAK